MASQPPDAGGPRWVWMVGIIVVIVVLLGITILVIGGGPGGHTSPIQH